jgi:hypothetical protein
MNTMHEPPTPVAIVNCRRRMVKLPTFVTTCFNTIASFIMKPSGTLVLIFFLLSSCHNNDNNLKHYSPSKLITDIDHFNKKILEIHPNPFTKIDSTTYFREIDSIKLSITEPMTSYGFYKLLAPVIIKIGDGHTGMLPDQSLMVITKLPFPFEVHIEGNRVFIVKNYSLNSEIILGSEILSINGISIKEIISTFLKFIPGESIRFKTAAIESYFSNFYKLCYGECNEFLVEVKQSDGIRKFTLDAIPSALKIIPKHLQASKLYFKNDIAILDLRNFSSGNFNLFIDSVFTQIKHKNSGTLIVDLRYNGGGQASLADTLLSYITDKEYNSLIMDKMKINDQTSGYVKQLQQMKLGEKKGDFYVWYGTSIKPQERSNGFKGKVYVLTSALSYSAAAFFANVIKCYNLGNIIGSETGQPLICYGDIYYNNLPNTKLPYGIARQKFIFCCAKDEFTGVIPDYEIKRKLGDKIKGFDTELDFTLKLINKDNWIHGKF